MNRVFLYGLVALLVLVSGYVAFATGYQDRLYRVIYRLVCNAEQQVTGTKMGQQRKEKVLATLHQMLPGWAKLFVSEADIGELIELAVAKMKKVLAEGIEDTQLPC